MRRCLERALVRLELVGCATAVSVALNVAHAPTAPAPSWLPRGRWSRCLVRWKC